MSQGKPNHADKSRKCTRKLKYLLVGAAIPSWALGSDLRAPSSESQRPQAKYMNLRDFFFGWPLDGFACISPSTTYQASNSRPPPPKELDAIMALAEITDLGRNSPTRSAALAMYATVHLH